MKMCMQHWDELKDAIKLRGLFHLISKNGNEATKKIVEELQAGKVSDEAYDPLLHANFAIWGEAVKAGGLYLMGKDEKGNDYCPLCEADIHKEQCGGAAEWINGCCDAILEECIVKGLVAKPS